MKRKIYDEVIYLLFFCGLVLGGGLKLVLYALGSLFGSFDIDLQSRFFFHKGFFVFQQDAFWVVYALLLIPMVMIKAFQSAFGDKCQSVNRTVQYGKLPDGLRTVIWIVSCFMVDSFLKFLSPFIVYLVSRDMDSIKRLLLFDDGVFSIYIKLWVILFPVFVFRILPRYRKAVNDLLNQETESDELSIKR